MLLTSADLPRGPGVGPCAFEIALAKNSTEQCIPWNSSDRLAPGAVGVLTPYSRVKSATFRRSAQRPCSGRGSASHRQTARYLLSTRIKPGRGGRLASAASGVKLVSVIVVQYGGFGWKVRRGCSGAAAAACEDSAVCRR
jgi:hypothetical protein